MSIMCGLAERGLLHRLRQPSGRRPGCTPSAPADRLTDAQRVDLQLALISEAFLDRLLVSHDIGFKHRLSAYGGCGYGHILSTVVPHHMRRKGMTEEHLHAILVGKPGACPAPGGGGLMRLARFNGGRLGVVRDGVIVEVGDVAGAVGDEWPPVGMLRLIARFDALRPDLEEAARAREGVPLEQVRLDTPLAFPGKVVAAPLNYRRHIEEMRPLVDRELHAIDRYGVFLKAPSSIVGPGAAIRLPFAERRTDHEVELGVVIGRTARDVTASEAMRHVFGYTGVLDITVRGDEDRSTRKSFDTFTPVGPFLVTADEVADPGALRLRLWVDGELRQDGNSADMIWGIPRLIEYASHVMTLHPGDLISTGTPEGVGPLRPGEEIPDRDRGGRRHDGPRRGAGGGAFRRRGGLAGRCGSGARTGRAPVKTRTGSRSRLLPRRDRSGAGGAAASGPGL